MGCRKWGCNKWGLKGCLAALPRNRPKSAFFPLFLPFSPFSEGAKSTWEIQKKEEKGLFPQISSDLLKPPSLKPPFAALQFLSERNLPETLGANQISSVMTLAPTVAALPPIAPYLHSDSLSQNMLKYRRGGGATEPVRGFFRAARPQNEKCSEKHGKKIRKMIRNVTEKCQASLRERPRGVENSGGGGGKHTVNSAKNPSPKTFLDPPPTIRFPPPPYFGDSLSFPLEERGTDQTQPQFLRPPKVVLESTLCSTPPPPPKFTR